MQPKYMVIIGIVVLIAVVIVFKSCQGTKGVEIKQKSNDNKSTFSVEVKKEKTDKE